MVDRRRYFGVVWPTRPPTGCYLVSGWTPPGAPRQGAGCPLYPRSEGRPSQMPLTVDIVTAERLVYSREGVDEVVAPGIEGELTVLPQHAPLLTMIKPGIMRIKRGNDETDMAITGGFLEVRDDRVTILADAAERAEEI